MKVKDIYWNDEWLVIVCAHVTAEEYAAASGEPLQPVAHVWGRWTPSVGGDYDSILRLCERGRGAFAFTLPEALL